MLPLVCHVACGTMARLVFHKACGTTATGVPFEVLARALNCRVSQSRSFQAEPAAMHVTELPSQEARLLLLPDQLRLDSLSTPE